jgi:hypothetical protein
MKKKRTENDPKVDVAIPMEHPNQLRGRPGRLPCVSYEFCEKHAEQDEFK